MIYLRKVLFLLVTPIACVSAPLVIREPEDPTVAEEARCRQWAQGYCRGQDNETECVDFMRAACRAEREQQ